MLRELLLASMVAKRRSVHIFRRWELLLVFAMVILIDRILRYIPLVVVVAYKPALLILMMAVWRSCP